MVSIKYNKALGNYTLINNGKKYSHPTKERAMEQAMAILRVEKKRETRKKKSNK